MAEWLYEDGIGEARAALVDAGRILKGRIERPHLGPRAGAVVAARYAALWPGGRGGSFTLSDGREAYVEQLPRSLSPGLPARLEITRQDSPLAGRHAKRLKARIVPPETPLTDGPSLAEAIAATPWPVRRLRAVDADALEEAGWSELLEEARTGQVDFPGGRLTIELTEALTVIDVDGGGDPDKLAVAGARAAAEAIERLDLAGSIAIDLPTASGKAARLAAAEAFDAAMLSKFERTAINGFGLLQVVMRKRRPSLIELIQGEPARSEALALYRRAEREPLPGAIVFTASHETATAIDARLHDDALARRRGTPVRWVTAAMAVGRGSVASVVDQPPTDDTGETGREDDHG
ncbi:MAG: ribonuclease E/G [Sphingomonas sp.]|nr:ribonuclease E/G [Sphingomonas sp.]